MHDATKSGLEEVFGLVSSSWMMNPAERLAIIGLLNVNLDWIDGRIQSDGPWGGLGIVLPAYPRNQPYRLTPVKIQNYALIAAACAGGSGPGAD